MTICRVEVFIEAYREKEAGQWGWRCSTCRRGGWGLGSQYDAEVSTLTHRVEVAEESID